MARPDTVYRVPIGEEVKIVTAQSKSQAISAATKPLLGEVTPLTAIELAGEIANGAKVLRAADILSPSEQSEADQSEEN